MKRILLAAILPVLFIACAKEDDVNPSFRTPTCTDTTDDGKFEAYTLPEQTEFLRWFRTVPETEDTTAIRYHYLNARILYNRGVDFNPYLVYRTNRPITFFGYLPLQTQAGQYYSWIRTTIDSSLNDTISLYQLRELSPQLQPGCYRLYYIFSDTDTGTVFTKGHYDLEIKY